MPAQARLKRPVGTMPLSAWCVCVEVRVCVCVCVGVIVCVCGGGVSKGCPSPGAQGGTHVSPVPGGFAQTAVSQECLRTCGEPAL